MSLSPEALGVLAGVLVGSIGVLANLAGTWWTLYQGRRMESERELRAALQGVATARFHLVKALFDLAHQPAKAGLLDECDERYADLLLAVQTKCQLQEGDDLRRAARRFKYDCLKPALKGELWGAGLAKQVRLASEDFNSVFDRHADVAGFSPSSFPAPAPVVGLAA